MLKGDDKQLYDYTMKLMENITSHYLTPDFDKETNIDKLIEHGIGRKIAVIMPSKYTEAEVLVAEFDEHYMVSVAFSIDGECELVAIHEQAIPAKVPSMMKAPVKLGVSSRGNGEPIKERLVAFKERLRKTDKENADAKDYPQYGKNEYYDPHCTTEDFIFPRSVAGRGSKVETLPGGQGLGELSDLEYFQGKVMRGLKKTMNPPYTVEKIAAAKKAEIAAVKPPTSCAPFVSKTTVGSEKPTVDFKSISQLNPPPSRELPRYEAGVHVGIDLTKVEVAPQTAVCAADAAKEVSRKIDEMILADITRVASMTNATIDSEYINSARVQWAVSTSGWSNEYTKYPNETAKTSALGDMSDYEAELARNGHGLNPFGHDATWFNTAGVPAMEEISFTEAELDELIDLIGTVQSEVMKFE